MGTKKSLLFNCLLLLLLSCCLAAAVAYSDADVIADLVQCLRHPPSTWTGSSEKACSSFDGVSCSSSGRVTAINLVGKGLAGGLPSSLSLLTELQSLRLEGNELSGDMPSLSRQGTLVHLSLEGNNFTSLPKDFLRGVPKLQHLSMDYLPLSPWPFPDAVFGCHSLHTFSASNASITGFFPAAALVARLTSITVLRLSHNNLTGVIPALLANMTSLKYISLSNNHFQGPVPEFAVGVSDDVTSGNRFCLEKPGPCNGQVTTLLQVAEGFGYPFRLAESWTGNDACNWFGVVCDMSSQVDMIRMDGRNLSGTISPAIANLTKLRILHLSNNYLTGEIPSALTTLPELEVLDVRNNSLIGELPKFKPSVNVWSDGNRLTKSGSTTGQGSLCGGSSSSGSAAVGSSKWNAAIIFRIILVVLVS